MTNLPMTEATFVSTTNHDTTSQDGATSPPVTLGNVGAVNPGTIGGAVGGFFAGFLIVLVVVTIIVASVKRRRSKYDMSDNNGITFSNAVYEGMKNNSYL